MKTPTSSRKRFRFHLAATQAFTRVDLIATIAVVILLAGWLGYSYSGERGRIARCTRNLQVLGEAMQSFANDHRGGLPPAGVEEPQITWDMLLYPYLRPDLAKRGSQSRMRELQRAVAPRFFCPSDPFHRGERPRSYAMPAYDMQSGNLPPGPDRATGVGLWWKKDSMARLLGSEIAQNVQRNMDALALVKLSWIPQPADTLLLTELPTTQNRLGMVHDLTVDDLNTQVTALEDNIATFHKRRFNYLMIDGHVELLSSLQTGPVNGSAGIWRIKKDY